MRAASRAKRVSKKNVKILGDMLLESRHGRDLVVWMLLRVFHVSWRVLTILRCKRFLSFRALQF